MNFPFSLSLKLAPPSSRCFLVTLATADLSLLSPLALMGCLPSSNAVDADYKRVSVEIDNMIKKSRKELK